MITTILLDDGGVLSDNRRRGVQWQHWLGLFLAQRLGGDAQTWGAANRAIIPDLLDSTINTQWADPNLKYDEFEQWYAQTWLRQMCEYCGVALPPEHEILPLYRESSAFVTARVDAAWEGVPETVRALKRAGYQLYTASNESSADLRGYLGVMGIRACFTRLYGPDLVDTLKNSPLYYQRISANGGIDPHTALVVDDNPQNILWAHEAGFHGLVVGAAHSSLPMIASLALLPQWLGQRGV